MLVLLMLLVFVSGTYCSMDVCDKWNSRDITAYSSNITLDGVITAGEVKYQRNEYFYDASSDTLRGCDVCKTDSILCIRKCCSVGYGYNPIEKTCVNVTEDFDPPLWDDFKVLKGVKADNVFKFVTGKQECQPYVRLRVGSAFDHSHLKRDGSLYVEIPGRLPPWLIYKPDQYCVDTFVFPDGTSRLDALICFKADKTDSVKEQYLQNSICMLISCVFILITCAVYAFLPELRNLHGKVLVTDLLCFFMGFSMMATMQILLLGDNINANTCLVLTFIIYFSLLSAFFWLNVMCFDIWWTFSGKRGLSLEKLSTRGRYFAYATYAFGIPTLLTILMAALEFSGLPPNPWLPMLKYQGCFLTNNSKYLYLYGPMLIVCCANLIFFILTAVKIAQIKQQTSVLKSRESSTHDQHRNDKQRLVLYVKLFAVTGINWIFEAFSGNYPQAQWILRIFDAYNVLLGVIIFFIFVCKRKIFRLIKKRYKQLRGENISMSRTTTTNSSRTVSRDETQVVSIKLQNR